MKTGTATVGDDDVGDDDSGGDDDATGDDDVGDDDSAAPLYYPGCLLSCGQGGGASLIAFALSAVALRRRRGASLLLLLLGLGTAEAADKKGTILVLASDPSSMRDAVQAQLPPGYAATVRALTGDHVLADIWLLGGDPERNCPVSSVPGSAVRDALQRAQRHLDELQIGEASAALTTVRTTLACSMAPLDTADLWKLHFLEGVAAYYDQGLPAARPAIGRALAVLPKQHFDEAYPPELRDLYLELQRETLSGGRALVVAAADDSKDPGAAWVDGVPISGDGFAVVPGEHVLQIRGADRKLHGTVIRLANGQVFVAALADAMPRAVGRLDRPHQATVRDWVGRWAGLPGVRVWIAQPSGAPLRVGEEDTGRAEVEAARRNEAPRLAAGIGFGWQLAGRGHYAVMPIDVSLRIVGPLRLALLARPSLSQPVIDPGSGDVIGRSLLASFGFGAQLRWEAPIGQWLGVAFQAAPSTPFPDDRANRKAGASFLPGVVGQAGLELGPRGSIVRFRPMVEGGVLGGFGLLRATASLSVNLGSR